MKIGFKNFRIFSDYQNFNLLPITVLTGPNNSGKSTIHNALAIMKNSFIFQNNESFEFLRFDEVSSKIGDYLSNVSFNSHSSQIEFSFLYTSSLLNKNVRWDLVYDKNNDNEGVLKKYYSILKLMTIMTIYIVWN